MSDAFAIRTPKRRDQDQIVGVVRAAFSGPGRDGQEEVDIAEATWSWGGVPPDLELVATEGPTIVGHILAGWGTLGGRPVIGIAPLSVRPDRQGAGIGKALMVEWLRRAEQAELPLAVLLGHPAYYSRFGFEPAGPLGITYPPAGAGSPNFQVRRFSGYIPSFRGDFTYCWESSQPVDHTSWNRNTYDRIARRYAEHQDRLPSGDDHWLLHIESSFLAGLPPGGVVADLGCGPANDGARLASKGCRVVGADISAGMLAVATGRLEGRLVQADLRDLPLGSASLDGVWNVASLLHVPDHDTGQVLHEFRRVMKPSGALVLVTALGADAFHEPVRYAEEESRWFVYRERTVLTEHLRLAGFSVVTEARMGGSRDWWAVLARSD